MNGKALLAMKKFLEARSYEVLDVDLDNMMVVAKDDENDLAFIEVEVSEDKDFTDGSDRAKFEEYMIRWFSENEPIDDCHIRFDKASLIVMGEDKALLRHHINCFSE